MIKSVLFFLCLNYFVFNSFSQSDNLKVVNIQKNSLQFEWKKYNNENITLFYGLTPELELGCIINSNLRLSDLKDATFYYVKAVFESEGVKNQSDIRIFSTASRSSGDITIYFNNTVDNSASPIADAIYVAAFEDTLIAYINRTQYTLDICNYNTGSIPVVNAINSAESRGVVVRYIAAYSDLTNNDELDNLSQTIPIIQRPDDGQVMHNKFMIIDSSDPALSKVITGSVNHTNLSMHYDYNNMVIVEDQALALAYKMEFEEMWGSSGNTPNSSAALFGSSKTDNTPHDFNVGGVSVELYFSPSDGTTAHIETAVRSANNDMEFAMLTFINNDLGDAVIDIHNSGVDIKGIIENVYYIGSEYNGLLNAGVDVLSHFSEPYFMHHKYGIADATNIGSDPLVVTGSHNWTNSAEEDYDENTLIIHSAEITNMYFEEFMARYAELTSVSQLLTTDDILIYPNPASEIVRVDSKSSIKSVKIYDIYGRLLINLSDSMDNRFDVNIEELEAGIYYLYVCNENKACLHKLVVIK